MFACAELTIEADMMSRRRLAIPLRLTIVAVGATLSGCNSHPTPSPPRQCPGDYHCTSDAARAENCTDASPPSGVYASDLGACYPPI
jgi:hypothetical protein